MDKDLPANESAATRFAAVTLTPYDACMQIGPYALQGKVLLAPMAGVTDRPFRMLCRRLGAALAASEMVASNPALRNTRKSRLRIDHRGEPSPRVVQIAGADPALLADAARYNVAQGAEIIDINMGCPAKKVCHQMAGSALLADEPLVARLLDAVAAAVEVPVTLKIRTGPDPQRRNAVRIARLAQAAGISALAIHGRTRDQHYKGQAEYDTIRAVRDAVTIPIIANGDIDSPQKAARILEETGCDAVMVGRAAQGRPWIFREIQHYLDTGSRYPSLSAGAIRAVMLKHLRDLHDFYGEHQGVRIARKHIGWYLKSALGGEAWRQQLVRVEAADEQLGMVDEALAALNA